MIKPADELFAQSSNHLEEVEILTRKFEDLPREARYIFGINVYTREVLQNYDVAAVIDDFTELREYMGTQVISSQKLLEIIETQKNSEKAIVLIVSGGSPLTARKNLREMLGSHAELLDYFGFQLHCRANLPGLVMNENFRSVYSENYERFSRIYNLLADDQSKEIYQKLTTFRFTQDLNYLSGFCNSFDKQYFEDFIVNKPIENFLDIGAFDGANSKTFIDYFPEYSRIITIEPDLENFGAILENLKPFKNVTNLNIGVGRENGTFKLIGHADTAKLVRRNLSEDYSSDRESGKYVLVSTVDELLSKNIQEAEVLTYIKMDIEGMELEALKGASNIIRLGKSIIGVCIYHHPLHFIEIPELVLNLNQEYKIYIRHYTESIYESVMYFIPKAYSQ